MRAPVFVQLRRALLIALPIVGGSCSGESTGVAKPPPSRPPTIAIVSGNGQTAEVGTKLPQPLVVSLSDSLARPIARAVIRFFDDGLVARDSAITNDAGLATVEWTLGRNASTQRIIALTLVFAGTMTVKAEAAFTATAVAGRPTSIRVSPDAGIVAPGTALDTMSATVLDRFENPISDAPVTWTVEAGGGSVRELSAVTNAQGKAHALWTVGASRGANLLAVTTAGLTTRVSAIASPGLPATAVVVGGAHSCALVPVGVAYCWGSNVMGELGNGVSGAFPQTTPVRVAGGHIFISLVAGTFHTCGLTRDGEAFCWGGNTHGQVGVVEPVVTIPKRAGVGLQFVSLAAGTSHTCGLTSDGTVYCWGDDTIGQLATGRDRSQPVTAGFYRRSLAVSITTDRSFVELAAAPNATCGIARTGGTYCWGSNSLGELGAFTGICRMTAQSYYYTSDWDWPCSTLPVPANVLGPLRSLTGAANGFCGVTLDRTLACWGNGSLVARLVTNSRVSKAWSLGNAVCGIDDTNGVSCWGFRSGFAPISPPLGNGVALGEFSSADGSSSCGLTREAQPIVYCWGTNDSGQLGDGTTAFRQTPVAVVVPRKLR